jgi:hypothetical protein
LGKAAVPDFRGLFLRGYGSQNHAQENGTTVGVTSTTHASGSLGTVQGDAIRNLYGTISAGIFVHFNNDIATGAFYKTGMGNTGLDGSSRNYIIFIDFAASRVVPTAMENRPVNVAVRYLIRAFP